ncbi:tyrosine-protein phosphatase 99A-like isoform X6 [Biomphalaria glabrata]|uniref:protein-tyrosine-phosphatase n=1 Tax=Biomphalaria glabrata TaxID=6526 RepID=A0A9W3A4R8_BIOGL|nr:tyrosine-protein phosphatase 99A-like isoform X6 [Biomphalaria glabrata]
MAHVTKMTLYWFSIYFMLCNFPTYGLTYSTVYEIVGHSIALKCPELDQDSVVSTAMWSKDTELVAIKAANDKWIIPLNNSRAKIEENNAQSIQLVIENLEMKDTAIYKCELFYADQTGSNKNNVTSTTKLIVQDKPEKPGQPIIKEIGSRNVTAWWSASGNDMNSAIISYKLYIKHCTDTEQVKSWEVGPDIFEKTALDLSPYTCYKAFVVAENAVGPSDPSLESDEFVTLEEATLIPNISILPPSEAPYNLHSANQTSTEIYLAWEAPPSGTLNGVLTGYLIKYGLNKNNLTSVNITDPLATSYVLKNLKPNSMYTVSIMAQNSRGTSPEVDTSIQTKPGPPSKPRITHINNNSEKSFNVNWEPPREINGKLERYNLEWTHTTTNEKRSRYITGHIMYDSMSALVQDLEPYTKYNLRVAAVSDGGEGEFSDEFPAFTDVAAPSSPLNFNMTALGSSSLYLSWSPPAKFYKSIDGYIIKGWDHRGKIIEDVIDLTKTKDISGNGASYTQHTLRNLATNARYNLRIAAVTGSIFSKVNYTGDFTEAKSVTLGTYNDVGSAVIRDYSKANEAIDAAEGSFHPGFIVAIVLGVLILVTLAALLVGYRFYNCRRLYQAAYLYLAVPSNSQPTAQTIITVEEHSEEKQYPDIGVADFISHVEHMHMDSDIGFSQEFDEINRTSYSDKYPCESSNINDNRSKNRYINIVAYDHSRVVLKTELSRIRQSDYINANYVDGYKKHKAYIATQGPLPQTFPDFWRMIWEQNSSVIVMITNLMEKGRRKCDQYWPNDGAETYGHLHVKLVNTIPRAHYTVRIFTLKNLKVKKRHSMKGGQERTVFHFHYTEWPDHGVPDYSLPVLTFVQKSAAQRGPDHGPIVVHCSAGVGRTGTYILIDSMIAQIEDRKSINIPGFTQLIRRQRNFLVQTEDQYIFIHELLVEYLLGNGSTEVKEEALSDYLILLDQPVSNQVLPAITSSTLLDRQYQLITDYTPNELDQSAALKPVNLGKNRVGSLLPVNLKRVLLSARPGVEGSDYINATYLQGYKKSSEFIVTQHPTDDTTEDFWRMVWDKNSPVIVVISPIDEIEYKEFWPSKGSSIEIDSGNFRLAMKDEPIVDEEQGFVTTEFILDSIQYDYTLLTRIILVKNWPQGYTTDLHKIFNVISAAQSYVNSLECGPLVVVDRFGSVEAGTFCALWTLRDQIISEKCADFYQVCKLYHFKRPGIIGTKENYLFLHQVLAAYCQHFQDDPVPNSSSPRHHHISLHHGSTRSKNGTLPRANANNGNNVHNSNTLPRSSAQMGRSYSGDSMSGPIIDSPKLETNI